MVDTFRSFLPHMTVPEGMRRIYMGGLPRDITERDIVNRFTSFGSVSKVDIIKTTEGDCRGFAYVDLECTADSWKRCVSVYNGRTWKAGLKLRLEAADETYLERLKKKQEERPKKEKAKKKRVAHAKNMSLVTEDNVEDRKGWRRGRFGRAMAVLKMKRPDGRSVTVDPSHYKDGLQKLFGSVKPKPVSQLTIYYDNDAFDNTQEQAEPKVEGAQNEWAKVVGTGMTFKLGLAPEEQECPVTPAISSPEQRESTPLVMLRDYNFATLFAPLGALPFPQNEHSLTFGEWKASMTGLSMHIKSKRKQAHKMQRRKSSLHFKASK